MEENMPDPKLKLQKTEEWTFEVFELEDLDENSRAEMAADPKGFFRKLLESEGRSVNALMMDEEEMLRQEARLRITPLVLHCVSPPKYRSRYLTVTVSP
jgi:hypothetical protein